MVENQQNTPKEFPSFFEGTPFADMMRKMMGAKKADHRFNCIEMMSQMMQMGCRARDKKEGAPQGTQETPTSKP